MSTSPTSFRLSADGVKALRILESLFPNQTRGEIVSTAICAQARGAAMQPTPKLSHLDPSAQLERLALLADLKQINSENRRIASKQRPSKEAAEQAVKVFERIDFETAELEKLRVSIASESRLNEIARDNQADLKKLEAWAVTRLKAAKEAKEAEKINLYTLELEILRNHIAK